MDGDDNEANPILVAMEDGAQIEVIRDLIEANPEWLRRRDEDGYLPIHNAIDRVNRGHAYVPCLLDMWPASAREATDDNYRSLPAHLVCLNAGGMTGEEDGDDEAAGLTAIRAVVDAYPQALQEKDGEGCLPLHLAFRSRPPPLEVTRYLVEVHRPALQQANDEGNVPFLTRQLTLTSRGSPTCSSCSGNGRSASGSATIVGTSRSSTRRATCACQTKSSGTCSGCTPNR
jgi:hypothetical protein